MMPSQLVLSIQLAFALTLVVLWRAFQPNTWANRLVSYTVNVRAVVRISSEIVANVA